MQMLRMQVQNSPQTQQVQVVQAQPQIIQVRFFSKFFFIFDILFMYNILYIFKKVSPQTNGPTPVYITQPTVNPTSTE